MEIIIYESLDSEQRMKPESRLIIYQGRFRMIPDQNLVIDDIGHYHSLVICRKTQGDKNLTIECYSIVIILSINRLLCLPVQDNRPQG